MPFGMKKPANPADAASVKLFNLDLHLAVIADVKDTLFRIYGNKVHVTHWSINMQDGAHFGFEKPERTLEEIIEHERMSARQQGIQGEPTLLNTFSWYAFDQGMVDRYIWRYAAELAKYDGFIVTHTPIFARLFEHLNKPVILVNSCRYDQPFCYNGDEKERQALHSCLKTLKDKGLLVAISNNRADQEYLRLGAGIDSLRIPSLCLYTKISVDWERAKQFPPLIVAQRTLRIPEQKKPLLEAAGLVQTTTTKQSASIAGAARQFASWDMIYHRKALIHFPYEMSTMSLAEQYSAGAVLLFPSRRFCQQLMQNREADNWQEHVDSGVGTLRISSVYWTSKYYQDAYKPLKELPPPFRSMAEKYHHTVAKAENGDGWEYEFWNPDRCIPEELKCIQDVEWWLDRADFYDDEWYPGIQYFDSWEEMAEMALKEPEAERQRQHAEWLKTRNDKVLAIWRSMMESQFAQLKT